jgi:hypothetical protein
MSTRMTASGIPHFRKRDRRTQDIQKRRGVGTHLQAARPVGQGAVEPHRAVVGEMEQLAQLAIERIGQPLAVAPCRRAHVAALAAEDRPAALGRTEHAVEPAERIKNVAVAIDQRQSARPRNVKRDRSVVADAVEHADHHRLFASGER